MESKIGVIGGLGHIGLIQAACLAKRGYRTLAYDIDKVKIEGILKNKMPFEEPDLTELVEEAINEGSLKFTAQIEDLQEADIIFVCVGTPSLPSGEADLSQVFKAVLQIALNRNRHCLVVIKSTVEVGTSRKLKEYLKENNLEGMATIAFSPEFLREGSGVKDFWKPTRIIVGSETPEAGEKIANLYAPPGTPVIMTTWENAELIKLVNNAFLSNKISFINEIALLCEKVGADIRIISKGIGLDPRINPYYIEAGTGFSGPCLEKDLKSLIHQFQRVQKEAKILEAVLQVNEGQRQGMVEKLQEQLGTLKDKRVGVLGMAFKENTDDVRQSHSVPIVKLLLAQGAIVTVTDPWVRSPEQGGLSESELPGVEWVSTPYEAAEGKDAILILTAWREYRELDLCKLGKAMRNPLVVDGRNIFNIDDMKAQNINYLGVGI